MMLSDSAIGSLVPPGLNYASPELGLSIDWRRFLSFWELTPIGLASNLALVIRWR